MIKLGGHEIPTPAICASIIGEDLDSMKDCLEKAIKKGTDLTELRLDELDETDGWMKLLKKDVPTIVTNRSSEEGGYFEGSEKDRIHILLNAIESGAPCVDIELSTSKKYRETVTKTANENGSSLILSFHDFEGMPPVPDLMEKAGQMAETDPDLAKLVCQANGPEEAIQMLDFLIRASEEIDIPIIAFAMGEEGDFTRVTAPLLGSPITYASVGEKTAPGQLNLTTVRRIVGKFRD